jgi:NAD(P)H-hydrate epimerase
MKLVDSRAMRAIDRAAERDYGLKALQLMENAGRAVALAASRLAAKAGSGRARAAVFTGKGNNGGDGFVAARHLKNSGMDVAVYSLASVEDMSGASLVNARAWQRMGGELNVISSARGFQRHASMLRHSSVVVDALLGIGISSPLRGLYAAAVGLINSLHKPVVAVDVPSGVDSTTGQVLGCAVRADITVTMALPKLGLYLYPGRGLAGAVEVADIGAPSALLDDERIRWNLTTDVDMRRILRPRAPDAHKGVYGHLLVIAGAPGMTGAAYMAATAAMRSGAGLVTIGLPRSLNRAMEAKTVEVMTLPLPETAAGTLGEVSMDGIKAALNGKAAVLAGPGLGRGRDVAALVLGLVDTLATPAVIDADGLWALSGRLAMLKHSGHGLVLTPHPGEMARLLGTDARGVQADRVGAALKLAGESGAVVVLKGASTVVASVDGRVYLNPTGNPGLSTAGTGDVLSGMIGGLLAQGYPPFDASVAAVYVHGAAADELKKGMGEAGMVASDLLPVIPRLMNGFASMDGC